MNFLEAIKEWKLILTDDFVQTSPDYLKQVETATFHTTAKVHAIISPTSVQKLKECLYVANKYKTPLYPISQGMNYGYGSKVPSCDHSAIVDLGRMNNIISFDSKQGVLTVEPGVTFQQAFEFLKQQGTNYTLAGTGAPPTASLIGNAVERGIGKGLASNRIDNICNLEVILPTGESFTTGLGRYKNSKGIGLTKSVPGPLFDGFFTQSNLGIITKMSFWLTPLPENFQTFIFAVQDEAKLPLIVDALHDLKQRDILRSSATLFNSYRMLGFMGKYPWDLHDGKTTLPDQVAMNVLKQSMPVAAFWYGDGALYSNSSAQARAERKLVKKALKGLVKNLTFFYEPKVSVLKFCSEFLSKLGVSLPLQMLDLFFKKSLYTGHLIPKEITLGSTYFRMKSARPSPEKMDPCLDNCGIYWMGPIVPFDGVNVEAAISIIKETITQYGFEPAMTLQMITSRQIDIIVSIAFDRTILGEDKKAKACHDELLRKLIVEGFYPYRLGIQSQSLLPSPDDDYCFLIEKIKKALDPNDILAPGRYDSR